MIRPVWDEQLTFAATATLPELIDPAVQITGVLEGELGRITKVDVDLLANVGLPEIKNWLYPAIQRSSTSEHRSILAFVLGTQDTGERLFTPDVSPEHFFIASVENGSVFKVSDVHGGYARYANSSIGRFVEAAWRYYHIEPVLFEMQYSGTVEIPFASAEEGEAIQKTAWHALLSVDQTLARDGDETFWWQAIWKYL